jgi:maltokinase
VSSIEAMAQRLQGPEGIGPLLADWLPHQRWYSGKARSVRAVEVTSAVTLVDGDPGLYHLVVAVDTDGQVDHYQLLLGVRDELPDRLSHVRIGPVDGRATYDAAHDSELTRHLLAHFAAGDDLGPLRFRHLVDERISTNLTSLVMTAEQSNTSMVFGDELILKMFRQLVPGVNPDLEVTLALASAGSAHVAHPVAWMETPFSGETTTLGMLQEYLRTATNGWELAITSVRDLYAEADLHPGEVGGDFAGESFRLGSATAEVHRDLAQTLATGVLEAAQVRGLADTMIERLEEACAVVAELAPYARELRQAFEELARLGEPVTVQRVHGDFHLGQVLRTPTQWVLLDFEGEPAKPLAERTALASPLRDVAAMLRSFDYAARHLLADHPRGDAQLEFRAVEWAERNREAFCDGYTKASGVDPRSSAALLRAFEIDKAVYECAYEARNRPSWLGIPLSAVHRLARAE